MKPEKYYWGYHYDWRYKSGTVTDIDGRYSLQVTPGDLVSFTFVGMADKVVKVQAGKKL